MAEPSISRSVLSRRVCEWMDWRTSDGRLQEGSCRKGLVKLHRLGVLDLPARDATYAFEKSRARSVAIDIPEVVCSLRDLGTVEVHPVTSRRSKTGMVWKSLMDRYHYLGSGPLCGAQMRYIVRCEKYGYLGALGFSSGTLALRDRDEYIGWSERARLSNIRHVVTNNRFLILPSVHVDNLASHVLSLTVRRLADDWYTRYHVRPVLAETFVDPTRFDGTCYKAAGWMKVGQSSGRRDGIKKDLYVSALAPGWRETLRAAPIVCLGEVCRPEAPLHWAQHEFGTVRLYDTRLKERLYTIAQDFFNRPQANIPEACGSKAHTIGAYRFFQNEKITLDVILTPHTESTIERIKEHAIVLAPQDTTTLNYSAHPATEGLGPINTIDDTSIGMLLHDTIAFTEEGTPLGVLDAQCWVRDPEDQGKSGRRKEVPIEQKESMKWLRSFRKVAQVQKLCPQTMLVSIGDRESDMYELFLEACKDPSGPKVLVRSERSRNRKVEEEYLWSFMAQQPLTGSLKLHIPKRGNKPARVTIVDLRFSEIMLKPPKGSRYPSVRLWAVYIVEEDAHDSSESPIEWLLLTTVEVTTFEQAKKCVQRYSARWGIEVYHRTLKSGCRIKDRQLGTANRLEACLGVDMVVAWRIYHLTMLGREVPDHPCTVFFEDVEWKALCCYYTQSPMPPQTPPTLYQAIMMLGIIGGHMGRKNDGMPGTQCIWRGLQRLDIAVDMYVIFTREEFPKIRQSYPYALFPPALGP